GVEVYRASTGRRRDALEPVGIRARVAEGRPSAFARKVEASGRRRADSNARGVAAGVELRKRNRNDGVIRSRRFQSDRAWRRPPERLERRLDGAGHTRQAFHLEGRLLTTDAVVRELDARRLVTR